MEPKLRTKIVWTAVTLPVSMILCGTALGLLSVPEGNLSFFEGMLAGMGAVLGMATVLGTIFVLIEVWNEGFPDEEIGG